MVNEVKVVANNERKLITMTGINLNLKAATALKIAKNNNELKGGNN